MKHITLIFVKVLSGLHQKGVIAPERKNMLMQAWQRAVAEQDKTTIKKLLNELSAVNTNSVWKRELNEALEEI